MNKTLSRGNAPARRSPASAQRRRAMQMLGMGVAAGLISASGTAASGYNDVRAVISLHPLVKR